MRQMRHFFSRHSFYIFILVLGLLAVSPVLINYRFVKDDTANVVQFLEFIKQYPISRLLAYVGTNEWLGYQPRSFFLTWWIQIGLIKLFGMNNLLDGARFPFAVFIAIVHISNALMLFKISQRFLNFYSALIIALGYLIFPWATVDYLVSNNWFFILPLFFYLLFISSILTFQPLKPISLITLFVLLLCVMFSGEQMIAVPYAIGTATITYIHFFCKKNEYLKRFQLQNLIVYGSGVISFFIYSKLIVRSPVPIDKNSIWGKNIFSTFELINSNTPIVIYNYSLALKEFIGKFLPYNSSLYGGVAFSSIAICLAVLFTIGSVMVLRKSEYEQTNWGENFSFKIKMVVLLSGLIGVLLPLFFGALTGARPGPDDRYLMVPTLFVFIMVVLLFERSTLNRKVKRLLSYALIGYFSLVTFHISWDVWRFQAAVDNRLWGAIFDAVKKNPDYILTINNDPFPGHRGLQRPYLSVAWTDFQADWGATSRLKQDHNISVKFIQYVEPGENGNISVIDYWGNRFNTKPENIQVIYLDDTSMLPDSLTGKLEVLNLDSYLARVKDGSIPNRIKNN